MQEYQILMGNDVVGTACIETLGLYTHIICRCHFPRNNIYRIRAKYGSNEIDLGVCIPNGDSYVVKGKVATKRLNSSIPSFFAYTQVKHNSLFVSLNPEIKFEYFANLTEATFHVQEGKRGIILNNMRV